MSDDIYSYIKENFGLEITDYQFKRDYIKEPLIRKFHNYEKPYKEDLEYLYNILNLSINELVLLFSSTKRFTTRILKFFDIKKDKKLRQLKNEELFIKKYGVKNPMFLDSNKKKLKNSFLEKYGIENPSYDKNVLEKRKQTCLKHYGVEYSFQSEKIKEKSKQTLLKKYGVEYISQSQIIKDLYQQNKDIILKKIFNTKRKNNSFNISKQEDTVYELLIQKYPNVLRQYKSKLYPFNCDFYIPELDLYIEYQGFWMHGFEPYTGSKEQKEKIKLWESKNTSQFKNAINTWTIRDPLKRETAKKNNLNYLEFFTIKQFINWFNQIK